MYISKYVLITLWSRFPCITWIHLEKIIIIWFLIFSFSSLLLSHWTSVIQLVYHIVYLYYHYFYGVESFSHKRIKKSDFSFLFIRWYVFVVQSPWMLVKNFGIGFAIKMVLEEVIIYILQQQLCILLLVSLPCLELQEYLLFTMVSYIHFIYLN